MFEKKARQYAWEISQESQLKKRRKMLEDVPEHLLELVKKHMEIMRERKKFNLVRKTDD